MRTSRPTPAGSVASLSFLRTSDVLQVLWFSKDSWSCRDFIGPISCDYFLLFEDFRRCKFVGPCSVSTCCDLRTSDFIKTPRVLEYSEDFQSYPSKPIQHSFYIGFLRTEICFFYRSVNFGRRPLKFSEGRPAKGYERAKSYHARFCSFAYLSLRSFNSGALLRRRWP